MNKGKANGVLTDRNGYRTEQSGDMVLLASVDLDADEYDGTIATNDRIRDDDYVALIKVVCEACFQHIKDPVARNMAAFAMRVILEEQSNAEG